MANRTWSFDVDGKSHIVLLKFGLIAGRQIWLDSTLINKGRNLFEMGSEYRFSVDGCPAELGIVSTPAGYEYYLRVNDEFINSKNDRRKKIGKSTARKFEQRQGWIDAGKKYGLEYFPLTAKPFAFQHRLIGYIENFLVLIAPGVRNVGGSSIPGYFILIRHSTIDADKIKELKNSEEIKKVLRNIKGRADWVDIQPGFTSLFTTTGFKKVSEAEVIERLVSIVPVISKSLKFTIADKCEGYECKLPYNKDLTLAFINAVPLAMCQECIDHIGDVGKKTEEEYKKQPDNLGKGTLYGLAATFLGAIVWALVIIFLDRIGPVFALLIFFLVVKAMDYAKTKRTFISLFIAGLLSLAGSIAGSYFGLAGYLFKEGKFELTLNEFIKLARYFMDNPKLLNETISFSLIGLVPYLLLAWTANRRYLKRFFKPEIEVIKNFEFKR
jgi:hypothetical protein